MYYICAYHYQGVVNHVLYMCIPLSRVVNHVLYMCIPLSRVVNHVLYMCVPLSRIIYVHTIIKCG